MQLNKTIETPMGVVRFEGEVTEEEFEYIIEIGLLTLMSMGKISAEVVEDSSLPFYTEPDKNTLQ